MDFNSVNSISYPPDDIYQSRLLVSQIDLFTKQITGLITWKTTGGRDQTTKLTTLITNPEAINGGDTCSSVLEGDWKNPQISNPFYVGNPIGGNPITSINVFEGKIYITTDNSDGQYNDFYIYDISADPKNPAIVNGPDGIDVNGKKNAGLSSVAISGNNTNKYAYVANAYGADFSKCNESPNCSQMRIIDVTNPASLILGRSYKLPSDVTGSGGQAVGNSIFYQNEYIYLGLTKTGSGPEFNIIDVHDPANPLRVGSYSVGRGINTIKVKNNYAYLTTDNNDEELIVLDVSNPTIPTLVEIYNALPDQIGGYGSDLYLIGNRIYLGRTYIRNAPEFLILDNTNPNAIPQSPLGSVDIGSSTNPQSLYGIVARDYLAFLTTGNKSAGSGYFQVWNISNLGSMSLLKSFDLSSVTGSGSVGSTSDCEGNYIYVGSYRKDNNKGMIFAVSPGN